MNYYVVETDKHKLIQKTAGVKARQDVETIFKWNNLKKIEIPCLIEGRENKTRLGKIKAHYDVYMLWKNALKKIKKNDWIYIQFPLLEHTMLFSLLIKNLEKRGTFLPEIGPVRQLFRAFGFGRSAIGRSE